MDIVEFVNALNTKIANLESANTELTSRVQEYEAKEAQQQGADAAEMEILQERLEEEVNEHHFTKLQLEDEQNNAQMSLKLLRELQGTTSIDSGDLQVTLQERESALARLQQELSTERERRVQSEALALEERTNTENQIATRNALKAMVSTLAAQLKQSQLNHEASQRIIADQKHEIDRKLSLFLDEEFSTNKSPTTSNDSNASSSAAPRDLYLDELDQRFKSVVDLVEEAEGKPLNLDAASSIKAALRDAKQVIGEEIILAHAGKSLEEKLRASTTFELQEERRTTTTLINIISELQSQLDLLNSESDSSNHFELSFVSGGRMPDYIDG